MDISAKIAGTQTYASLAEILQRYYGANAAAVRDAMGLWHVAPGNTVSTTIRHFPRPKRGDRVVFLFERKKVLLENVVMALVNVKLKSIDLEERLRRLRLLSSSERLYAQRELRHALAKARLDFEGKLELFGRYSHDLKTPFSMLIANLEGMILSDEPIPVKLRLRLETIRSAIYSVLRTAGQSLDAARLMARKKRATLVPYDYSAFVREVVEVYGIVFESYGIRLETEIAPDIPAEIDPIQMEKILNNLLSNAIKHNIPGGIAHVSLKQQGAKIELAIADTGLGFKPETTKIKDANPSVFSSHGYGLQIVRDMVRAHRGSLKIRSSEGIGTTVTVTLPASPGLQKIVRELRRHNFQTTLHEVEFLSGERTRLSRRRRTGIERRQGMDFEPASK